MTLPLHEAIHARQDQVMQRWQLTVQGTLAPESMPIVELLNHFPRFLHEVLDALRADAGLAPIGPFPGDNRSATDHGEQRLRLGFSLDSVIREYGALRDAIIETGREAGSPITFREMELVFAAIIGAIAQAVSEYTRQRDAELQRQHNEHVAFMAHELREPLSSSIMAFDLLKQRGTIPTDVMAGAALERGLLRMQDLIARSLYVARAGTAVHLRKQPLKLEPLFHEAEASAASEAEARSIELRYRIEHEDAVELDERLMRSALSNLVRNAVKYSGHGGAVEIRARVAGERLMIEVEDTCGGLEPGKVEQAFAPFARDDGRESGFGLGLAIAKQAVDAHGGSIRVQNLPGKGCIFVLDLPLR